MLDNNVCHHHRRYSLTEKGGTYPLNSTQNIVKQEVGREPIGDLWGIRGIRNLQYQETIGLTLLIANWKSRTKTKWQTAQKGFKILENIVTKNTGTPQMYSTQITFLS